MPGLFQRPRKPKHGPQAVLRPGTPALYPFPPNAGLEAMNAGLVALEAHLGSDSAPGTLDDERPIFIAAVGWRVGSTLLQRLCCSDKSAIVWGEVLGNMGIINRLSEAICIARPGGWPFPDMWLQHQRDGQGKKEDLSGEFIANLYPSSSWFREGLQRFLFQWLGEPARQLGFRRWGLKETRLSATDALFLRWLFPNAVFLPIVRHPFKAYQSCLAAGGDSWVEPRANNPKSFAQHWNRLAMSWVQGKTYISAPMIRYEELISSDFDFGALSERVDLEIQPDGVLSRKAGASPHKERYPLSRRTRSVIRREARKGMEALGYQG